MTEDKEIKSMSAVLTALEPLDSEEQARVIAWVSQKLSIANPAQAKARDSNSSGSSREANVASSGQFKEFHQLFDAATPETETDRALVGAYWFQVCQTLPDFSSQQVNDELKQLGHPISNVTKAFDRLQSHKPVLARQVQKTGKSQQGRKRYKLTREGQMKVEAICRDENTEE
jgi:hypothetical protein